MNKELHIWIADTFGNDIKLLTTFYSTEKELLYDMPIVHTTQTHFCSTIWITKGYRIFIHMLDGSRIEIKLGYNSHADREIRIGHNLEKMLLANVFGRVSN